MVVVQCVDWVVGLVVVDVCVWCCLWIVQDYFVFVQDGVGIGVVLCFGIVEFEVDGIVCVGCDQGVGDVVKYDLYCVLQV